MAVVEHHTEESQTNWLVVGLVLGFIVLLMFWMFQRGSSDDVVQIQPTDMDRSVTVVVTPTASESEPTGTPGNTRFEVDVNVSGMPLPTSGSSPTEAP